MKYVRTKDGVYKVVLVSPLGFVRIDKRDGTYPDVFEKDILKQANTIEELCDEFVIEHLDGTKSIFENYDLFCQHRGDNYYSFQFNNLKKYDGSFYGAIWTDKGLIYVAKMNDKGELELL